MPAKSRRGTAERNNRIHWPNAVKRRAAAELTNAVTRHRGVRPNNSSNCDDNINNSNHVTLAERFQPATTRSQHSHAGRQQHQQQQSRGSDERFQPSTLHKLRQLGRYTNMDTPDTAHQLGADAVAAEVTYARTNTQPSCSGGGESDRVSNTFKEAVAGLRHHTS